MQNAIISQEQAAVESVMRLANIVRSLRNDVFKEGLDYGRIPGTGEKPTLLLPGMEKLMRALHLRPEYVERSRIEDFDKPLIYYRYECRLMDYETGICVSTAIGSANSQESKWRWRASERACPKCGKETIKKSKFPPKGAPEGTEAGWYCYAKIGGCGAEFAAKDPQIIGQAIGRVENPDIFDQMNTIDKIAQKRALGSAIKGAANVSELFTVDMEDFTPYDTSNVVEGSYTVVEHDQPPPSPPTQPTPLGGAQKPPLANTPPTAPISENGGSSAGAEFFPDDAKVTVLNSERAEQGYSDFLCHELVYTVTNGGSQYTFKSEYGTNIVVFGSEWVLNVADYKDRDMFKNTPGKKQLLNPPLVVTARFADKKWDVEQITTLEAVTR